MNPNERDCYEFRGVKIDDIGYEGVVDRIAKNINKKGYICVNDVNNVVTAAENDAFRIVINQSLVSIADGMPLAWYGKLLGRRKIERISGVNLMRRLLEQKEYDFRHFLLGGSEETIDQVIKKSTKINAGLKIAGYSPPFKKKFSEDDNRRIMEEINTHNPDIIWVSLGGRKQEFWMNQNIPMLKRGIMIGVGAAFRYYTGELTIPPEIMQKLGLQWFYRMLDNPKKWFNPAQINKLKFVVHFPVELIKALKNGRK